MPDEDEKIFGDIYRIYNEYRWRKLAEDDFIRMTNEVAAFAEIHRWKENPLAFRLAQAILDTFNDMYAGGKVPKIPDYFGRSDL
jgi:hypothetical protein